MAKNGENIYRRKDGRWEGRYIKGRKKDGKIYYGYIYGYKYYDVKEKLFDIKVRNHQYYQSFGKYKVTKSFETWVKEWLILIESHVKYNTYMNYKSKMVNHVIPKLGDKKLNEVNTSCLQELFTELAENLSESSVYSVYRVLHACFSAAIKNKVLSENPLSDFQLPNRKSSRVKAFSLKEQAKLEEHVLIQEDLPSIVALYTGVRIGELCGMKWRDINWDDKLITINRNIQRQQITTVSGIKKTVLQEISLKTDHSQRIIPLTNRLYYLLKKFEYNHQNLNSAYVFQGKNGGSLDPRTIRYRFSKLKKRAGVTDLPFHSLRHTFATRCIEMGVPITTVSSLLGHSSIKLTLDIYTNSFLSEKRKAIEGLERLSGNEDLSCCTR